MKASQHTAEQIIKILEQAEKGDQTIGAICRTNGIAENTFYRWRKTYGGMSVNEAQRLKELERENARLKRLLADRMLEVDALKEFLGIKGSAPLPVVLRCASSARRACRRSAPACWCSSSAPASSISRVPQPMTG